MRLSRAQRTCVAGAWRVEPIRVLIGNRCAQLEHLRASAYHDVPLRVLGAVENGLRDPSGQGGKAD